MDGRDAVADLSACCPTCGPAASLQSACSLTTEGLAERLAEMRTLARRTLLRAERRGLILWLAYRSDASAEVAELIAHEADAATSSAFGWSSETGCWSR